MKVELTSKEQQVISGYRQVIAQAESARTSLTMLCTIIIERAGGDTSKPWNLTPDGSAMEEVQDGVAPQ